MTIKPTTIPSIVTQGNSLIESGFEASLSEMRLLYLALTKVDTRKAKPETQYIVTAREYREMFDLDGRNAYDQLKQAALGLGKKPITTYEWHEQKKKIMARTRYWFSELTYDAERTGSELIIQFSDSIKQFLYELKNEFTQLDLKDISQLDTPFAYRLYSWLYRYRLLTKKKNKGGVISTEVIALEWIKERTGLKGKYPGFQDFRRRVLEPAVSLINAKTNITVTFDTIKSGKTVTGVQFHYIDQREASGILKAPTKPLRPRLPSRPRVKAGSAREREWAMNCLHILNDHKKALEAFDPKLKLTAADRKKMDHLFEITGMNSALL